METRANYVLVGLFTLAVVFAGFGFVFWFSRGGVEGDRLAYRVVFEGSVSGLRTGGSVLFNGIKVGEVTDLRLNPQNPQQAVATVAIDKMIPVRADTRANLEFQGLTGIASIGLKGGQPTAEPLPGKPGELPTIVAEPSAVQDLWQGARELLGRADSVVRRVDTLLADNERNMTRTMGHLEKFTAALGDNSDAVTSFITDAAAAAKRIAAMSDNIDKLAADLSGVVKAVDPAKVASAVDNLDKLIRAVDPTKVASTVDNVETLSKGLAGQTEKIAAFIDDARAVSARLNDMAAKLDPTIERVGQVMAAIDPDQVRRTVESVDKFTQTLSNNSVSVDALLRDSADVARKLNDMSSRIEGTVVRLDEVMQGVDPQKVARTIDNADKFAASMGQNSQKVDAMMADAADIARKFNEMTPRIDRILVNVEGLTGSDETKGALAEVADAARAFKTMSANLDKRFAELSTGLNRFTNTGLRQVEALASDGRRTLSEIDRAVKNFDRNPSRVLFGSGGGGSVPQYNGRR